jgi:N-acetylmuramoyl-L-alanine amidase
LITRRDTTLEADLHPSPNFEPRRGGTKPTILLLHYTGVEDCASAIEWLARPASKVSCHYVVDADGRITQMVAEAMRAWHAGASFWAGERDINSASIGIEIHNPGHAGGYPKFPEAQLLAVEALCQDIITRKAIRPERILAHSDVAPRRKIDPGEKFPWARLASRGIGHWVTPVAVNRRDAGVGPGDHGPAVKLTQALLHRYGYDIEPDSDFDIRTQRVVRAFQRHFRPKRVDGRIDKSTIATLERLLAALPLSPI